MRLQIGPKLENNKVRLDFKQSPGKPDNTPSYSIDENIADEFVNKYNEQSKTLMKFTVMTTIAGAILAFATCLRAKTSKIKLLLGSLGGSFIGFGCGVGVSAYKKHKIMEDYNLKEI